MLPSIAQVLLTLHVLISLTPPPSALHRLQQVDALPITSKPIESTAENLAWQAWIMMPPHEQNLEKSRKVTPKSIFLLPNRVKPQTSNVGGQSWTMESESGSGLYAPIECPPGQRQFESRCISTVDIDREQLLIQELQILLQHGDNGNGNNGNQNAYDYDYDYDEETVAAVEANYKAPMMFRGGDELASSAVSSSSVSGNYDDAERLPNEDAPLKFNIFSDNYPTDLEAPQKQQPFSMMGMANLNNSNPPWNLSQMLGLSQLPNVTNTLSEVYGVPAAEATQSVTKTTPFKQGIPIMGIDAIVLPAEATSAQLQKLSFLKDDSGVQLVSTVATGHNVEGLDEQPQESAAKLTDLLKFDSLLPLNAPLVAPTAATTTTLATTATLKATTVKTAEKSTTTSSTTFTKRTTAANQLTFTTSKVTRRGGGVDLQSTTTTTNMPKQTSTLLAVDGKRVTQQDQDENEERTRSVTLLVSAPTIASSSSTVNEPPTTTNLLTSSPNLPATTSTSINASHKQLDETTLIEMPAEAADVERQGSGGVLAQTMLKKMKVEPVVVEHKTAITDRDDDEDDDLFVNPTTPLPSLRSNLASAQAVYHNNDHYDKADTHDDHDHDVDHHDPNLDRAVDDRFSYQPVGGDGVETTVVDDGNGDVDASGLHKVGAAASTQLVQDKSTTTTTTALHVQTITTKKLPITKPTISLATTTKANSEIDVAAELRAIHELVKQNQSRRPQGGAIKKKTTMAAKTTTKSDLKATTKAASGFKISEQQLGKITTDSATSASSETATTATTAAIEADVSATASTTAARVTTETIPAETSTSAASTMSTVAVDSSATATATVAAVEAATATLETETPIASEIATASIATTTMPSTTIMATITPTSAPTATSPPPSSLATTIDDAATSTASLWAKILPLLGFPTTATQATDLPATATSPTATQTQSSSSSSSSKSSLSSSNRSLRNSKITRIDKLSTNSLSDSHAKKATTTTTEAMTTTTTTTTAKQTSSGSRVKAYVVPLSQSASDLSTVLPPPTTTARTKSREVERDDGGFSPFWWVPAGWRLDRPSTSATSSKKSSSSSSSSTSSSSLSPSSSTATTRTTSTSTLNKRAEVAATAQPSSLLLRFWSAFPGNQVKVKE